MPSASSRPSRSRVAPLAERSELGRKIADGEFVTMVEIVPPKRHRRHEGTRRRQVLEVGGRGRVNIPDSPRASARMSNQALCLLVKQQVGIEPILHYTCRDRNVLGIQSDLLGASAIGIRNLICITGDPPKMGDYPDATAVFDVDCHRPGEHRPQPESRSRYWRQSHRQRHRVRDRRGRESRSSRTSTKRFAALNTRWKPAPNWRSRSRYSICGCWKNSCGASSIAGFRWSPASGRLTSARNAEFMKNELRVSIPDEIFERMAKANTAEAARAEGVAIARDMLAAVRSMVQGAQISAPFGRYSCAVDVLEAWEPVRRTALRHGFRQAPSSRLSMFGV